MVREVSSAAAFAAALKQTLKRMPRGSQAQLAEATHVSRQQLNDIINGRSLAKDDLKDRLAHRVGSTVPDLILAGIEYLQTGVYFPYLREIAHLQPHSFDRAAWIYRAVAEEKHLGHTYQYIPAAMEACQYPGVKEYVAKTINDGDIYAQAHKFFDELLTNYAPKRR